MLVVAIVVAALTSTAADWDPPALVALLLGLALATDWFAVSHGGQRISGSFLALVLAAALLGPAPATAIGIAAVLFDQVRARNPLPRLIANLAAFATFPLVGGLIIDAADVAPESAAFPLLVFATFLITNLLNFLMIGGHHAFETRTPLADGFRRIFVPVLPSEILSAVLCALVATFYARTGVAAIALMLFVLLTFQYLLRELLLSRERAERLAGLQLGVLISMIETLALRDRMTARHSAAVARYARAMAKALGWSAEQQDLVHTAGLLHDIGKFAFPDSILLADSRLTDEQWQQVKRHPEDGAADRAPDRRLLARGGDHPRPPRALGRPRLPALARGRGDPLRRADHRRRRHLRRDHRARLLPQADLGAGGDRRAAPVRGRPARPARRRGLHRPADGRRPLLRPRRRRRLRGRAGIRAARSCARPPPNEVIVCSPLMCRAIGGR